jgi:DNA topoisomerase-1
VSVKKEDDPFTLTKERAIEIILAKREADANKLIKSYPENAEVLVLNGRWGPYISISKNNCKIPKGIDPTALTLEDCLKFAEEAANNPKRGFGKFKKAAPVAVPAPAKKAAAKKTAKKAATKTAAKK